MTKYIVRLSLFVLVLSCLQRRHNRPTLSQIAAPQIRTGITLAPRRLCALPRLY
jgi:hypothetical protein